MKKILIILVGLLYASCSIALSQDIILKITGEHIKAKVVQISADEIIYKTLDNLDGPSLTIPKADVKSIKYENGVVQMINDKVQRDRQNQGKINQNATNNTAQTVPAEKNGSTGYRDRIGLCFGGGSGFEYVPVVILTDGSKASLSFGGGIAVKFEYGHEFSKHFDVEIDAGGQFSKLDKYISNGSVDFSRSILSATPSYIFHIGKGEGHYILAGIGLDLAYNADLNINLDKAPGGFTDDWKYKGGVGEHFSLFYKYKMPFKRLSFKAGLIAYNVNYQFKSGGVYHPTDDNIINPQGGGVEFICGISYNFR
jgi:hypothetical protein